MTRLWYVDGVYKSYEYLHTNEGYTTTPSISMSYLSAVNNTWGQATSSVGYYSGTLANLATGEYFVIGTIDWYSLNSLTQDLFLMPTGATTLILTNDIIESNAAYLEAAPSTFLYFVQAAPELGWMTEEELELSGWHLPIEESEEFGGNFTTGDTQLTDDVNGGQGVLQKHGSTRTIWSLEDFSEGGSVQKHSSTRAIITLENFIEGNDLNIAYFTNNGSLETQNSTLSDEDGGTLYDYSGNAIQYYEDDSDYEIITATRINKGSTGALWDSSDLNTWLTLYKATYLTQKELDWNTGLLSDIPSDPDIYSLMYKKVLQPIVIDLKLKSDGSSATFSNDDYWYSYFRSSSDQSKAEKYGLVINDNQLDADNLNTYSITIMALLDVNGLVAQADLSNFYVGTGNGKVRICNYTAYTTQVSYWRVFIDQNLVTHNVIKLFLRSSSYQNVNKSVAANSTNNYLYPEGEDGMYRADSTMKYRLGAAYTNTGSTVDITGCNVSVLYDLRLVLSWGSTGANVCYITVLTEATSSSITVLLGLRYDGNDWLSKTFDANDFWWSGILSEEDKTLIESIGLRTSVMFYGYGGQIGSIEYNAGYTYQILGLYSDIDGTQQVQTDLSNLYVAPHTPTGDTKQYAAICNYTAITTPSMTWKVKISPKGTVVVAYKADGTTSNGVQNGNNYIITAVDSNWHTEAELNALGWYVQWNLYTFSSPVTAINIRNTPSLSTSTVIAVWPAGTTLVGNPYLEQTVDGRVWQTVKFSLNGGTTVQTGYCIVDSQVPVTHTTGTAETDVLLANTP